MEDNDTTHVSENGYSCETLAAMLWRAAHGMKRGHHHHGATHPAQGRILSILHERGSMNRRELLDLLDVRSGSLSELLGKLERHGFIVRKQDQNDKREFVVSATDRATEFVSGHEQKHAKWAEALFSALSVEERNQLGGMLAKLIETWESTCHEGGHGRGPECRHGHHRAHGRGKGPGAHGGHEDELLRGMGHGGGHGRTHARFPGERVCTGDGPCHSDNDAERGERACHGHRKGHGDHGCSEEPGGRGHGRRMRHMHDAPVGGKRATDTPAATEEPQEEKDMP